MYHVDVRVQESTVLVLNAVKAALPSHRLQCGDGISKHQLSSLWNGERRDKFFNQVFGIKINYNDEAA